MKCRLDRMEIDVSGSKRIMRQIENKIQIIKGSLYWGLLAAENENIPMEMRW